MHINFNASVEDAFIWKSNKNGNYTTKSGYTWLLSCTNPITGSTLVTLGCQCHVALANHNVTKVLPPVTLSIPTFHWSWIWKLKLREKLKFLFWLACHNSIPTLILLNHKNLAPSAVCSRCGIEEESFLHYIRDCIL